MRKKFNKVYQFKITLMRIKPPIWRKIQVPESYTFWDLHVAIQDAMGWLDYHLHRFELVNPSTGEISELGIPEDEDEDDDEEFLPGWEHKIARWFSMENKKAIYEYDFGDCWKHSVKLEKILDRDKNIDYPVCIGGKQACPPEDCGSIPGYERLCEIMKDKNDEEYEEMIEWLGKVYYPEYFDVKKVRFDDPDRRYKIAFSGNYI